MRIAGQLSVDAATYERFTVALQRDWIRALRVVLVIMAAPAVWTIVTGRYLAGVLLLVGAAAAFVFVPGALRRRTVRDYVGAGTGVWTYDVDERRLLKRNPHAESELAWSAHAIVKETDDYWFVQHKQTRATSLVPKAAFTPADRQTLGTFFAALNGG